MQVQQSAIVELGPPLSALLSPLHCSPTNGCSGCLVWIFTTSADAFGIYRYGGRCGGGQAVAVTGSNDYSCEVLQVSQLPFTPACSSFERCGRAQSSPQVSLQTPIPSPSQFTLLLSEGCEARGFRTDCPSPSSDEGNCPVSTAGTCAWCFVRTGLFESNVASDWGQDSKVAALASLWFPQEE